MQFSLVALFILFRETVEASIVVSVLLQFLARSFPHLKRQVWWGVAAGVALSIVFGVVFSILFYVAKNNLFTGDSKAIFKGCIAWFAAILMTFLAFAMLRYKGWEEKIKRKLEKLAAEALEKEQQGEVEEPEPTTWHGRLRRSYTKTVGVVCLPVGRVLEAFVDVVERGCGKCCTGLETCGRSVRRRMLPSKYGLEEPKQTPGLEDGVVADLAVGRSHSWGIFLVVFSTVLREGIESVIFLAGVGNNDPQSLILPGVVGLVCGLAVGFFLYYTGKQVKDIKYLLIFMSLLLFFIAAGQVMLGTYFLMTGGMFGYCSVWVNDRPWYMQPVWRIKCCIVNDLPGNEFWVLSRAIVGYTDQPSLLEVIFYFAYWFLIIVLAVYKGFTGSLFDADYKYKRQMAKEAKEREAQEAALAQQLQFSPDGVALAALHKKDPLQHGSSLEAGLPGPLDSSSSDSAPKALSGGNGDSTPGSSAEHAPHREVPAAARQ